MQKVVDALKARLPQIVEEATDAVRAAGLATYTQLPREQVLGLINAAFQPFIVDLENGTNTAANDFWRRVGANRARQGASLIDILQGIRMPFSVITRDFEQRFADEPTAVTWWVERMSELVYNNAMVLAEVFLTAREEIIREQSEQLYALSTPIIPIYTGILVLPLVGNLDAGRAGQVMETLLMGISENQAEQVIIDITGVPMIDTTVVQYLVQAASAATLLGSHVVLVGTNSQVAQTLVHLGVDLSTLTTRANLQAGIEYALGLQNLAIRSRTAP